MIRTETGDWKLHVWPWLRRPGARLLPDWLAITIGSHILSWRPLGPWELAHELEHVRQWRESGLLFVPRYLLESHRHGYRGNRFEVAARAAGQDSGA